MANDLRTGMEPSLSGLVTGIVHDAQELIKQQLALFRHEIHSDVQKAKEGALSLALGMGVAFLGSLLMCLMLVHLLNWSAPALPLWSCYGIVGIVLLGAATIFYLLGKKKIDETSPLPEQSVEALKENVQWIMKPR
jgi:uncharacterized membrane protein YqjE